MEEIAKQAGAAGADGAPTARPSSPPHTALMPDEVDAASAVEMADRLLPFLLRAAGGKGNG